ncbi:MAG: potassium-transporting ATPase subunit KdpB [Dehalococcoidia bacterium]|uniref:potassium-transporting ATPase subunit KdpB n=1 Tax=Candidatus Amarobacter glycogenicus TaxID=3140699 RepID=UPI001DDE5FDB|nr:potassium-transporting ATPase subunit KdpB [Dehalococcoidia bacterium]MBK8558699.1 potassium-transporting ATPase subunit KdpB [Dehalococcoidia bacterium]
MAVVAVEKRKKANVWTREILSRAIRDSLLKLDPRTLYRNPIMLIVELGAALTSVLYLRDLVNGEPFDTLRFEVQIAIWLWFTVIFANFAEAIAEGRGKAQAATLRKTRTQTTAQRVKADGTLETVPSSALRKGDIVVVGLNELIPGDGDVVEGIAYVNEAAITGESAPVLKEPGTDIRSSVTGGTTVVSDELRIRITANPGETFLDRMIGLVEGASRQKTPNEIALNILLAGLTFIFLMVTVTLQPFANYAGNLISVVVLVALLVCLIPTTIGGLLSAIGIAGMDRLVQRNVLAMSGRAVEAAGDIDTLLLDKTGTITFGNRLAAEFIALDEQGNGRLIEAAVRSSLLDTTPEGRSILDLAKSQGFGSLVATLDVSEGDFVPFAAETRMSGIRRDGRATMKGAADAVVAATGRPAPAAYTAAVQRISSEGGTPLGVIDDGEILGLVYLKDTVKPGMAARFEELRRMGIRTIMVTGDNPLTAATIAREAGVDDFIAQARPEDKIARIREEQAQGRLVAMTGDGTNDAPALAQADVGVAMNSGTQAAKEAGNMVDLDSDPTKLIEIVGIGKQLLMTRGALTTFSIANDVAKYFAILPAAFVVSYPVLDTLNIMRLESPESAILSAIIFNALVIIALVPLALRGVAYKPIGAGPLLARNALIYGLGGIAVPFIGIKLIDMFVNLAHLA